MTKMGNVEDAFVDDVLLAGHQVQPGLYKNLSTGRVIHLESEGLLPGSLDGRIACYVPLVNSWGQIAPALAADR